MSVWARSGEYDPHYGLEMLMSRGKSGLAEEKCQCGRDQVNVMGDEAQQPLSWQNTVS